MTHPLSWLVISWGDKLVKWMELVGMVLFVYLNERKDYLFHMDKKQSVHGRLVEAMCKELMRGAGVPSKCLA